MVKPPRPSQHARFRAGLNVLVDPRIREIHPLSPLAGHVVKTDVGYLSEELLGEGREALVPVYWKGQMYSVEEEYICLD